MSEIVSLEDYQGSAGRPGGLPDVFFDRREFELILNLYFRMVAKGEWRDYAIGHDRESCAFSVFRRSADSPLYRILKTPKLARKQGAYAVLAGGRVLKRGKTLAGALDFFNRKRLQLV